MHAPHPPPPTPPSHPMHAKIKKANNHHSIKSPKASIFNFHHLIKTFHRSTTSLFIYTGKGEEISIIHRLWFLVQAFFPFLVFQAMKVPFPVINNNHNNNNNSSSRPLNSTPSYEPKSVLELRGSPSPVTDLKQVSSNDVVSVVSDDPLDVDHLLINQNLEGWDSLMRELGLHEDNNNNNNNSNNNSAPKPITNPQSDSNQTHYSEFQTLTPFDSSQFVPTDFSLLTDIPTTYPTLPLNPTPTLFDDLTGNWNAEGFDYVDELIRLAECFETNSLQLGHVILTRLNQRLRSPTGKPLQRAAFYFKEALQSLLTGSPRPVSQPPSSSEIIQTIKAQKTFSSISPAPMFASFTANQAVLEAIDGSMNVHVIDFEIGLGGHWASFMKEMTEKSESPVLRISAVVLEDCVVESRLVRENLTQFARDLNIRFEIEFVPIRTFEYLSFKSIKFVEGEKIAVVLSPAIFRQVGTGFLADLRRVAPHVVVHVDIEGQVGFGTASYRQAVIDGLEFYSTLLESLEAANLNNGGDWMRRIETFVMYPKIVEGVKAAGRRGMTWKEALMAAGLRQVGLSQFADFQAECLLRRVQVRGFHVAKRQAELLLCWHDRPLVATSAWR